MKSSNRSSRWFCGLLAAILSLLSIGHADAQILWYNGDDNGVDSDISTSSPSNSGVVYEDFTVTAPGGWQVNGVFGNFLYFNSDNDPVANSAITSANWFILSGVSVGNGGTVVASGTSAPATVVTNTDLLGNPINQVTVANLSFDLAPGTYWLGLQPISTAVGYLATTSGANAIGTSTSSDAFVTDTYGNNFQSTTVVYPDLIDFSSGVTGTAPEPSTSALVLVGVSLIAYWRVRARRV